MKAQTIYVQRESFREKKPGNTNFAKKNPNRTNDTGKSPGF